MQTLESTRQVALDEEIARHEEIRARLAHEVVADEPALAEAEARVARHRPLVEAARAEVGRWLDAAVRAGLVRQPGVTPGFTLVSVPGEPFREPTSTRADDIQRALTVAKEDMAEAAEGLRPLAATERTIAARLSQNRARLAYCDDILGQLRAKRERQERLAQRRERGFLEGLKARVMGA